MPRLVNPVDWELDPDQDNGPLVSLKNRRGHRFHIHPISATLVRIIHTLPHDDRFGIKLKNHREVPNAGRDGIVWEQPRQEWKTKVSMNLSTKVGSELFTDEASVRLLSSSR